MHRHRRFGSTSPCRENRRSERRGQRSRSARAGEERQGVPDGSPCADHAGCRSDAHADAALASGATGASGLSLRGTITGRLSLSMTRCFRGMPKDNGSVPDGPASPCHSRRQTRQASCRPARRCRPGRFFKRLLNGLPDYSQAAASWLPTACAAMGFAQRGLLPVVRYQRSGAHCFGRNTGMRQSCPSGRSSQTSGP